MNILVIEDDKETADFLKASLEAEGFVADAAADGNEGLRKAMESDYDILILDVGLPGKDGRQIAAELRDAGRYVPIIVLSVAGEVDSKVDLLDVGADDYLAKPFSFNELKARIGALLRRPKNFEGPILRAGGLSLNVRNRTVAVFGKGVLLRPKEFFLLEYLMRNKKKVVSRAEILKHVWGMDADPLTNTVDMHIASLRRKICLKFIRTVSGSGYGFCYNNGKVGRKNKK